MGQDHLPRGVGHLGGAALGRAQGHDLKSRPAQGGDGGGAEELLDVGDQGDAGHVSLLGASTPLYPVACDAA